MDAQLTPEQRQALARMTPGHWITPEQIDADLDTLASLSSAGLLQRSNYSGQAELFSETAVKFLLIERG